MVRELRQIPCLRLSGALDSLGKPTSPERLQLAPGGLKQLHPTKTELSNRLGSRKSKEAHKEPRGPALLPAQSQAPPSTPPHQSYLWSRPLALAARPYVPREGGRRSWREGGVAVPAEARAGEETRL